MKALTICQPYPRLIMIGEKRVENRTWYTKYRGPLLIHAGKSRAWMTGVDEQEAIDAGDPLIFGAIVGAATLEDCIHFDDIFCCMHDFETYPWLSEHLHAEGPWCWILDNVVRYTSPIPWRGSQGLFDVPEHVLTAGGVAMPVAWLV